MVSAGDGPRRGAAPTWIPIFYAVAMGVSGLGSLVFGRWADRAGLVVLVPLTAASALVAPLVFLGGSTTALIGVALWGVGMGVHEVPTCSAPSCSSASAR